MSAFLYAALKIGGCFAIGALLPWVAYFAGEKWVEIVDAYSRPMRGPRT